MKWQLTLQIGINDCTGDMGIDGDCQSEGGRERKRGRGIDGDKEGGKGGKETCGEQSEMMQPIGKLLPRAIVCCVCTGPLFRSLLTSCPSVRERERMGGFKMTDMAR